MITRLLVAVVFIPVVLLTVSVAPLWCFFLLLEVFLVAALWEFYRVAPRLRTHRSVDCRLPVRGLAVPIVPLLLFDDDPVSPHGPVDGENKLPGSESFPNHC